MSRSAPTFRSLRRHHNYRLYSLGQLASASGTYLQDVALPWLILEMTHSPLQVAIVVACRHTPFAVFGLWGGVVADRYDNRFVLLATQAVAGTVAAALAALALTDLVRPWVVFLLALISGFTIVFENPSRNALTYQLVGSRDLSNAIALNSSIQNGARVVGPAVGGVLIASVGVGWCFAINTVSFAIVAAALLMMRVNELYGVDRDVRTSSTLHAILEVLRFFWSSPPFRALMVISVTIGLCGFTIVRTQLPLLTTETLHSGSRVFGFLFASYGAGALAGALLTATARRAEWRRVVVGAAGVSVGLMAIAPLRNAVAIGIVLFVMGVSWSLFAANGQTLLQLTTPDRLRGRAVALYVYGLVVTAPLGGIAAGWLTEVGSVPLTFLVSGMLGAVATAVGAVAVRGSAVVWEDANQAPLVPVATPSSAD